MKNVQGKDIPIDTPNDKREFYNKSMNQRSFNLNHLDYHTLYDGKVNGKDDDILNFLIPWCHDNEIESIADVGCDWGKYACWMRQELELDQIFAYDLSDKTINNLSKNLSESYIYNIVVNQWDIELNKLPIAVDLVLAIDLIEHFVDLHKGWDNLLQSGKYVYTLVPKDRSFEWSEDHLHIVTEDTVEKLISESNGLVCKKTVNFDGTNSWFSLLVKGHN